MPAGIDDGQLERNVYISMLRVGATVEDQPRLSDTVYFERYLKADETTLITVRQSPPNRDGNRLLGTHKQR